MQSSFPCCCDPPNLHLRHGCCQSLSIYTLWDAARFTSGHHKKQTNSTLFLVNLGCSSSFRPPAAAGRLRAKPDLNLASAKSSNRELGVLRSRSWVASVSWLQSVGQHVSMNVPFFTSGGRFPAVRLRISGCVHWSTLFCRFATGRRMSR